MQARTVVHPQLGPGTLLKTYKGGFEWEVLFESGRRFRLPAREFDGDSTRAWPARPSSPAPRPAPALAALEADQFRARQTLESLRLGIVPVRDVETLTIGLEAERVSLERALVRGLERGGDVQAVIGDYGFGKSHFVELAARRGLRENMLVAVTSLDLVEVPPSKAHEIYRALTPAIRYPDTDERGLRPLLRQALAQPGIIDRVAVLSPDPERCPLTTALRALADCDNQSAYDDIVEWLGGQFKPTAALRQCLKRPPRLYVTGEIARQYTYLLTGIATLARLVGYGGLAVLIDESEHYSLLRANQRQRADSFFKAMICAALGPGNSRVDPTTIPDHLRVEYPIAFSSTPHLFFLFALTESENRVPVDVWLAPSQIVRLDDRFIEKDVIAFFDTLLRYHAIAYAYTPAEERYGVVATTAPALLARALGQHRLNVRELIRLSVTICDLLYLYPDYAPDTLLAEVRHGLRLG